MRMAKGLLPDLVVRRVVEGFFLGLWQRVGRLRRLLRGGFPLFLLGCGGRRRESRNQDRQNDGRTSGKHTCFPRFGFAGGSITKEPKFTKVIRSASREEAFTANWTAKREGTRCWLR